MQRFPNDRGITVSEMPPMDRPIDVSFETTAAFVGRALRGPLNLPVPIANFADFRKRFGGLWHRSALGPAVLQFFEHGGRNLYVVRVANNARGAMLCIPAAQGVLVLRAVEPGSTERIRAAVDYDGIADADETHFNLTLQRIAPDSGLVVEQEIYRRLSCDEPDRRYIGNALAGSELVSLQLPLPSGRPWATIDPVSRFEPGYVTPVQPGTDGSSLSDYDLIGSAQQATGLFALEQIDHFDLLYMPPPGRNRDVGPAATLAAELYCRRRGAMLILDPAAEWQSPAEAIAGTRRAAFASANILSYFPRLKSRNEEDGPPRAAGGALAGLLCALDRKHGPWQDLDRKDLAFRRHLAPAVELAADDAGMLIKEGLNVIAREDSGPATLRGSVTLARNSRMDREFASLAVRRLCLAITNGIGRATRWAVFERDDVRVAERVHAQVHAWMSALADAGAFAGGGFAVQCEAALHPRRDPERGVTILLTFQPAGARNAVSLSLHQTVAGCRVATTAFAPVMRCA
jgi:uncharacterized protein